MARRTMMVTVTVRRVATLTATTMTRKPAMARCTFEVGCGSSF